MVARLFYSNNMKTMIFAAVLSAAGIMSANAQEAVDISANYNYHFTFMPSCLTTNGKSVPVGINVDENGNMNASIMDADLNVVKQFKIKVPTYVRRSYSEFATVKPSGAEIQYYYKDSDIQYTGEVVTATDMNSLVEKLSKIYEGIQFYGFTDLKGNVSCYSSDLTGFYELGLFGSAYPESYFSIIDGTVYRIQASYKVTLNQADLANAEWSSDETFHEYPSGAYLDPIKYHNCDSNIFYDGYSIYVSQALFNEDDKWEYFIPLYGSIKKTVGDARIDYIVETGVRVSRTVDEEPEYWGIGIYNEDGSMIASLKVPDGWDYTVYISNGNTYLKVHGDAVNTIYKYDRATSSVKEISRSKSNAPIISMNGRRITVGADGNNIDEAVLYDMGGRSIASSRRTNSDNITINAANVAQGVYNVALKNKGRIAGAQKIIIK